MWTDPDRTPVILFPLALDLSEEVIDLTDDIEELVDFTPTVPIPLVRKTTVSWDPPPLRKLLESAPPPPRLPMRSQLEIDCALSGAAATGSLEWSPAVTVAPPPEVPWQPEPPPSPARARWTFAPWIAMGAAYAFGMTSIVALEGRTTTPVVSWAKDAAAFEAPALGKSKPASDTPPIHRTEVAKPLRVVGFVTDPEETPKAIDLERLNVTVAEAAERAASGCGGKRSATTRVEVTFAPSGQTTAASLDGGPLAEPARACITNIMRDVQIPAFSGGPTTVEKRVTIQKKR